MRRVGLMLVGLGALLLLVSFGTFLWLVFETATIHTAHTGSATLGAEYASAAFEVSTSGRSRVGVRMRIESDESERMRTEMSADDRYRLLYEFPMRYVVEDANGRVLHEARDVIDGRNELLTGRSGRVGSRGGWSHYLHGMPPFDMPPGTDRIGVRVLVEPDTTHGATAENLEVVVQDRLRPYLGRLLTAIACLVLGILALVVGGLLIVFGSPIRPMPELDVLESGD